MGLSCNCFYLGMLEMQGYITYVYRERKTYLLCSVKTFFREGYPGWVIKTQAKWIDCEQSLSFPSVFLAFLRALSYRVASSEMRFLELALGYRVASGEMRFLELAFLSLICIILTEFCARRISGTKTDCA